MDESTVPALDRSAMPRDPDDMVGGDAHPKEQADASDKPTDDQHTAEDDATFGVTAFTRVWKARMSCVAVLCCIIVR